MCFSYLFSLLKAVQLEVPDIISLWQKNNHPKACQSGLDGENTPTCFDDLPGTPGMTTMDKLHMWKRGRSLVSTILSDVM